MKLKKILSFAISFVVILTAFVPVAFSAESEISEVNIAIPVPIVGETISSYNEIDFNNDNCRMFSVVWVSEKNRLETFAQSDVFLSGYNYSVIISLDCKGDNVAFADDCAITVNGEIVNDCYYNETKSLVIIEYDFGKAEEAESGFSFDMIIGYINEIIKKTYKVIMAFFGIMIY